MIKAIRHWKVKGVVQKTLSLIPGGGWVNDRLQRHLGDLRSFEGNIDIKVADWAGIMSYLQAAGRPALGNMSLLEIGSGWYPTLPLCFKLGGASGCTTVDISRHMDQALAFRMLRALRGKLDSIAATSGRDPAAVREEYERMVRARTLPELLQTAAIRYLAPADGARLDSEPAESVDIVYSNSVFEHVRPEALGPLMCESWRLLKPGGITVHAVACNDHYAHFDKGISYVNYLRFPEAEWRRWNNPLNYQNRLRASDFLKAAEENGFEIVYQSRSVRAGVREAISEMEIAPEFRAYSHEDLIATSVAFVGLKPQAQGAIAN